MAIKTKPTERLKKLLTTPAGAVFLSPQVTDVNVKHVLAASQFNPKNMAKLFGRADYYREMSQTLAGRKKLVKTFEGRQLCSLFYEPSTRTRVSFEAAATKLGMGVVSTENAAEFSSAAKGETIEDTIQVLNQYGFDAIVLRHKEKGAAARAAVVSQAPILNGGDGTGEHPTQALLDAYTIQRAHGWLDGLKVVIGGDLKHGRTARSLAQILSQFKNVHLTFVSVPELRMDEDVKSSLRQSGTSFDETDSMTRAFKGADVVYWTRLQKERLENPAALPDGGFVMTSRHLSLLPKKAIIMHPLPRVGEISPTVDSDPRAKYFEQAGNGLYIRMALLNEVIKP